MYNCFQLLSTNITPGTKQCEASMMLRSALPADCSYVPLEHMVVLPYAYHPVAICGHIAWDIESYGPSALELGDINACTGDHQHSESIFSPLSVSASPKTRQAATIA